MFDGRFYVRVFFGIVPLVILYHKLFKESIVSCILFRAKYKFWLFAQSRAIKYVQLTHTIINFIYNNINTKLI